MQFLDRAKIFVRGGDGGNGVTAFRREKFVPRGGPSGGDGGRGGDVYLESTDQLNTLLHFRLNPQYKAERGRHGEGDKRHGRAGDDLTVPVPVGTSVFDSDTGELIHDFVKVGEKVLVAPGGRGGLGNAQFATSTNRAPRYHQEGKPGVERNLQLELKLIADVGLVGFPNAGKSTLISRISAARPKIADYPFTTLEPNLGVVDRGEYKSFVVADIPGLIEGASQGAGLGHDFLRHVERTRLLLHLVDVSDLPGRDPVDDFYKINHELEEHSAELIKKPQIVVATKIDAMTDSDPLEKLKEMSEREHLPFIAVSAVAGTGIDKLIYLVGAKLDELNEHENAIEPVTSSI
ncbi:MAG TPA: GTPase ObgE [Blastocatellia bacterium]|nr:GTPase ObgE [Blastocatellia bacterium]